jgi:hypothetical protein
VSRDERIAASNAASLLWLHERNLKLEQMILTALRGGDGARPSEAAAALRALHDAYLQSIAGLGSAGFSEPRPEPPFARSAAVRRALITFPWSDYGLGAVEGAVDEDTPGGWVDALMSELDAAADPDA